jgi:hypothetical protein
VIAVAGLVWGLGAAPAAADVQIVVDPLRLEVATFTSDAPVRITVRIDPAARPVVVIRGPETEATFNRKIRIGPIWLNSGQVHVSGTPTLLLRFSPGPIETLLGREAIDAHQLDAEAIERTMHVAPAEADEPAIRDSYLALRTGDGSYRFVDSGDATVTAGANPGEFTVTLLWPTTAPTATYDVTVYECRDGAISAVATMPFDVAATGVAAWLAGVANTHAALYGAVAVAVAITLGFGIDFLVTFFRRRGGGQGRGSEAHSPGHLSAH